MDCRFGEKTYENYMNIEWGAAGDNFAPNTRLEKVMGVDSIFYINDYPLTVLGPFYNGVILTPDLWEDPDGLLTKERIPECLMNLFIQYKCADYLTRSYSNEYDSWDKPYYRFHIKNTDQLEVLCNLENTIGDEAFVSYALPACWEIDVLYERHVRRNVVVNSHFVPPRTLANHSLYTFVTGGYDHGKAFSDYERIESIDLEKKLREAYEKRKKKVNLVEFIDETFNSVNKVMRETKGLYGYLFTKILENDRKFDYEIQNKLSILHHFFRITEISWQVLGSE